MAIASATAITLVTAKLAMAGAIGLTGGVSPAATSPVPASVQQFNITCPSPSLGGTLPARIYLPAGYGSGRRYPVVYFLHGLPANPTSYESNGFVAAALAADHLAAIVVTPQGARSDNSDREYLDWSPQENWPRAFSHDLVDCIDHRYHTIAARTGRLLAGLSAGGFGAFNIGLRNLAVYGAVESWSGYFAATDPTGLYVLDLHSTGANAAARVPSGGYLKQELTRYPSYVGFYVGDMDSRFLTDNETFSATLSAAGIAHTFRIYPGGHSYALWRARAPIWLAAGLSFLAHLRSSHG